MASIYKNFPGNQNINRDDVAAVLKTNAGSIQRDVAAAAQYLLLERIKGDYCVSDRFRKIQNFLTESERKQALLEAFGSPKLYAELIEKHDGHAIPTELKTHLIRFHKIAEKAAPGAADLFIENAKYVGAANEHNILNYKQALLRLASNANRVDYAEVIDEGKVKDKSDERIINFIEEKPFDQNKTPLLPEIPGNENVKVPLSEKKFAFLSYPPSIKKRDIEILRKQLDLLELLAE